MSDKSYVTVETHACEVCGNEYDTGSVLLDRRLRPSFERTTCTALSGLCPKCQKLYDDGFVALIAVSNVPKYGSRMQQKDATRTGVIAHLRRTVADAIFNVALDPNLPMVFVEPEVITKIQAMQA